MKCCTSACEAGTKHRESKGWWACAASTVTVSQQVCTEHRARRHSSRGKRQAPGASTIYKQSTKTHFQPIQMVKTNPDNAQAKVWAMEGGWKWERWRKGQDPCSIGGKMPRHQSTRDMIQRFKDCVLFNATRTQGKGTRVTES